MVGYPANKAGVYAVIATTKEECLINYTLIIQAVWNTLITFDKSAEPWEGSIRTLNPGTFSHYILHDGSRLNHFNAVITGTYFLELRMDWNNQGMVG